MFKKRADRALNRACQRRGAPSSTTWPPATWPGTSTCCGKGWATASSPTPDTRTARFSGSPMPTSFPRRVRALVLDSVVDPIAWTTGRGDEAETETGLQPPAGNPAGAQATLEEFFRLCDAAGPEGCALAGNCNSPLRRPRRAAAVASRYEYVDPETGETVVFTYAHLIWMTWFALNTASDWPDLAEFLAELEGALNPESMTEAVEALTEGTRRRPTTPRYPDIVDGHYGVLCSDSDTTPTTTASGRRRAPRPTAASATSVGCGPGSPVPGGMGGLRHRPLHRAFRPPHRQPGAVGGDPLRSSVGL